MRVGEGVTEGSPAAGEGERLRFQLLGPVRAFRGATELEVGSARQKAMLAALVLRGGCAASPRELVADVWGEEGPDSGAYVVAVYVARLRRVLGPDVVRRTAAGYVIAGGDRTLDVEQAMGLADAAERAVAGGGVASGRALYAEALARWTAEPLAGVPGPFAASERERLSGLRLQLLEERLALDLRLGRHAEAERELRLLAAAHPLRERSQLLLMTALYRSGRLRDALGVFIGTREALAHELGLKPASELVELQQTILQQLGDGSRVPLRDSQEPPADPELASSAETSLDRALARLFIRLGPPPEPSETAHDPLPTTGGGAR